ncbi:MAG: geranylgeranylglycerol-phosphate geranylgeranyltransferase [Chitinophagaceae bacterium]
MRKLPVFLKLIRYPNLIYIALTQYLVQYFVIIPILAQSGIQPSLDPILFFLLVLSTLLIAAAGYIINDYFDVKIDLVNNPEKIIVDKKINRRWAMAFHTIFNLTGVFLGFYLAQKLGHIWLGSIQVTCTFSLWFYSTSFKRKIFIGNIVISLLTALTLIVVGLYEPKFTGRFFSEFYGFSRTIFLILAFYSFFAFIISMVREMVKDMEDIQGDSKEGCKTIPVVWGIKICKNICVGFILVLLSSLLFVQFYLFGIHWMGLIVYFILLIEVPLIYIILILVKTFNAKGFHRVSSLIKLVMLTGILSMAFIKWLI